MENLTYVQVEKSNEKSIICNTILNALPHWFGVPESIANYTQSVADMPFYACYCGGIAVGFVAIKAHNTDTAEVCVMGVLKEYHRMGIGKRLISACIGYCKRQGYRFLTVKTLADLNPDEGYAKTRAFYLSCGFHPLEVFPQIWDERNPCLLMVMAIACPISLMYRPLYLKDLSADLLAHFNRYQQVKKYYAKQESGLTVADCNFTELWDEDKKRTIIDEDFKEVLAHGGAIYGAFHKGMLMGFACYDGRFIGDSLEYLQLIYLHVSCEYRHMGMGRTLFQLCADGAKGLGAKKLYISAASAYESQLFYRAIGCVEAENVVQHLCDKEPYDIQMEYLL